MLVTCWSVKGGSGTTVVAATLSLVAARSSSNGVLPVDVEGDLPAALGAAPATGPGVRDWLAADPSVSADALRRLEVEVGGGVRLLPAGEASVGRANGEHGDPVRLVAALREVAGEGGVIVDAGRPDRDALAAALVDASTVSILVIRPCYLALRRAVASDRRPHGIVVVDESTRALTPADIEDALDAPVVAAVPTRPEIARAVDAGLLSGRVPRALANSLKWTLPRLEMSARALTP